MSDNDQTNVAIACQGGGSHSAFTAGVLQELLENWDHDSYELIGLSGTSGGALCAYLAWSGIHDDGMAEASRLLEECWDDLKTANPILNTLNRTATYYTWLSEAGGPVPKVHPKLNVFAQLSQDELERVLREYGPEDLDGLVADSEPGKPRLLISAVDAEDGSFALFSDQPMGSDEETGPINRFDRQIREQPRLLSREAVLASAALPTLLPSVELPEDGDTHTHWDGLFSQNPPIRNFLSGPDQASEKPDEIWVIRINPVEWNQSRDCLAEISDRRNELAGNLSLFQELFYINAINEWVDKGYLEEECQRVRVRDISLGDTDTEEERDLARAEKLKLSPSFVENLMTAGRSQARDFLADPDQYLWVDH